MKKTEEKYSRLTSSVSQTHTDPHAQTETHTGTLAAPITGTAG